MINKTQLKEIINDLREIIKQEDLYGITPSTILEQACQYHRGQIIEQNRQSSHGGKEVGFSPSIKQFKILSSAGLTKEQINKMTKLEVSKVIGEYLNSLKKENI
jgi:DNA-directed RNA polymerase subunit H (RpoH/RPB5)